MTTLDIYADRDTIRAHGIELGKVGYECCGFIVNVNGKKQKAVRCNNSSKYPFNNFQISPEEFRAAEAQGEILAVYHSHVNVPPIPSDNDKTVSEAHRLPFIIYSHPSDTWDVYTPCGWRAKLEGRPFCHGILDCYSLVKDYYSDVLGIELEDFHRPDDWWLDGKTNLYLDNALKQGFVQVYDLHVHDILLMQLNSDVPNHSAIYAEPGIILHHPPGHISGRVAYTTGYGYYADNTYGIFRHRKLM